MLLAEALPALAQGGGLPTPINPLTVSPPGRPAYSIATYNVRPQKWLDAHRPVTFNLTFQGQVVAIIPQDVPLNHKGVVFIASHGFQSDSALEIRDNDASIRRSSVSRRWTNSQRPERITSCASPSRPWPITATDCWKATRPRPV